MALTRSQLLAGDGSQGTVLSGQVQGVKQGVGVLILPDGTINFDSATATGVVRLNNAGAYNAYVWPTLTGAPAAGTILQSDGAGGLLWTTNYVATTGATGAANLPVGVNAQRPVVAAAGQIRFNDEDTVLEYYNGVAWIAVAAAAALPDVGLGLVLDGSTVKASTLTQFGPPAAGSLPAQAVDGSLYWDDNLGVMFIRYNDGDSTQWVQISPTGSGGGGGGGGTAGVSQIVAGTGISISPVGGTGAVTITATGGGGGGVSSVSVTGPITDTGTATAPIIGISTATTASTGAVQLATAAEAATGTNAAKTLTPATGVPKTPANMTGALYLPGGNNGARPSTPATGMLRYNSQGGTPVDVEYYDGTDWTTLVGGFGRVFAWGYVSSSGGTAVLTASGNVASIGVPPASGTDYITVNFITPAPTTNYAVAGLYMNAGAASPYAVILSSSSFRFYSGRIPSWPCSFIVVL